MIAEDVESAIVDPDNSPPQKGGRPREIKFNLLENGIDFVRSGIERYFLRDEPSPRDHKYAVLHIFAGVLLLMKERLRREHDSLIFVKVEEAGSSDAITVNFKQVVDRLTSIAKIDLRPHMTTLQQGQRTRNRLEHYAFELDLKDTQEIVGNLCGFVYVFMRDELGDDLATHLKGDVWSRVQDLRAIAQAIEAKRQEEWKKRVAHYGAFSKEQLEKAWNDAPRPEPDDGIFVFYPLYCPECGKERVIGVERGLALCTNPVCGEVFVSGECLRCNGRILGEDEGFCEECMDHHLYSD
jgi:hypothetical protein